MSEQYSHPDAAQILRRRKAKRRLITLAVVLVIAGLVLWYFENSLSFSLDKVISLGTSIESSTIGAIFSAPTPLSATSTPAAQGSALTRLGVIEDTNAERGANGNLPALAENTVLDDIATLRLEDMFQNQYFAHVSPYTSSSAETVAATVGYSYIALGENLALGNFAGDNGVVTAWMNSPGHRANILDTHYSEIGVAVQKGLFQGQTVWIAVQVFGRPASACPSPDANLMTTINNEESQLSETYTDLQNRQAAINSMQPQSGPEYNEAVDEYNAEVTDYNTLETQAKTQIGQYNAEVTAFNTCLEN